jgi:hypothetical protein
MLHPGSDGAGMGVGKSLVRSLEPWGILYCPMVRWPLCLLLLLAVCPSIRADDVTSVVSDTAGAAAVDASNGPYRLRAMQIGGVISAGVVGQIQSAAGFAAQVRASPASPAIQLLPTTSTSTRVWVDESGRQALVAIILNGVPTRDVIIPVTNPSPTVVAVSTTQLTFTVHDWDEPHLILISGIADGVVTGDLPVTIDLGPVQGTSQYAGMVPGPVYVMRQDNDAPGLIIAESGGTTQVVEGGGADSYTVRLTAAPSGTVQVSLAADSALSVSPGTLTFTPGNWSVAQTVVVNAVNDLVAQGGRTARIRHLLSGGGYGTTSAPDVLTTITDNDAVGVAVVAQTALTTTEAGGTATVVVSLTSQPTDNVTLALSSSASGEGAVSPASITFTPSDWALPRTVTCTGIDDAVADGDRAWSMRFALASSDAAYSGLSVADVNLTNRDNDSATLAVSPAGGLVTSESGLTAAITVRLGSQPTATVTVGVVSSVPGEASASPTTLTFTAANWAVAQTVTVTGVPDGIQDGDQAYVVTLTPAGADAQYAALSPVAVGGINRDIDRPGVLVVESGGVTTLAEGGAGDSMQVSLLRAPAGGATVTVSLSGNGQLGATPSSLVFTAANWSQPQTVAIAAIDDALVEADPHAGSLTFACAGGGYDSVAVTPVAASIVDNDVAGFEVSPTAVTTADDGRPAFVLVRLTSQPTADATIAVSTSDPAQVQASPASLTFTATNWNVFQAVTVRGLADGTVTGDRTHTLILAAAASADADYQGVNPTDATVLKLDLDRAGLAISPSSVVVDSNGGTAVVAVHLATIPTAGVTVTVGVDRPDQATVLPTTLSFTPANAGVDQQFTVTGLDDLLANGDQAFNISLTPASTDSAYAGLAPATVSGINIDSGAPRLLVNQSTVLAVTEADPVGVTYQIRLSRAPSAPVDVALGGGTFLVLAPASLQFDASNWSIPVTVRVTAPADLVAQGAHTGYATHTMSSSDGAYAGVAPLVLPVAITDIDRAGVVVTAATGLTTTEVGGTATFTVRLGSQPAAPVTLSIASSDSSQGTVSPASIGFGAANWSTPQTITITGADGNAFEDGDVPYQITVGPAASLDTVYAGMSGDPVPVVNLAVDNPPTLSLIADVAISEDAGPQSIALAGISNGQAGESQTVSVVVSSDNPALTGPIALSWSAPATSGSIEFTPVADASGTAVITVAVSDGVATVTRTCTVTIAQINDLPVIVRSTLLTVPYRGAGAWTGLQADPAVAGQLAAQDAETPPGALMYRIQLAPTLGTLAVSGSALAAGGSFLQSDIDAGLVTYSHGGGSGTQDGFVVQVDDTTGGLAAVTVVHIAIDRLAPAIDPLPSTSLTIGEGDPAVPAMPLATVEDAESTTLQGGRIEVRITAADAGDLLAIANQGTGPGQVSLAASVVAVGGLPIGTVSGGAGGQLTVDLTTSDATIAAAQAVLRALVVSYVGHAPPVTTRSIQVRMTDDHGDISAWIGRPLIVTPIDDPPTVAGLTLVTPAGVPVRAQIVASDPDSMPLTLAISRLPAQGTAAIAADGVLTYTSSTTADGIDQLGIIASAGGVDTAEALVDIRITGLTAAARPWVVSLSPLEYQQTDVMAYTAEADLSSLTLPAAAQVAWRVEDAPAGLVLLPAADAAGRSRVTVRWDPLAPAGATGHVEFTLVCTESVSGTASAQRIILLIHALPGGGG